MKTPVRYIPLLNGTAFMGMGPNTGLNEGKEYPYVLYTDYEALQRECALVAILILPVGGAGHSRDGSET